MGKRYEVTAVLARRDYPHALQRLLHDRTSRKIARALGRYEHVDLAVVPYYLTQSLNAAPPEPPRNVDGTPAEEARVGSRPEAGKPRYPGAR
jgi:hypothetical protein